MQIETSNSNSKVYFQVRPNSCPQDIFFVHGNLASLNWWTPVIEIAHKSFSASHAKLTGKMVSMDLRGHGRTTNPTPGKLNVDEMVNDLIAVAEETKISNAIVVGHSAGGLLGALLVARRPDLFSKILLIDPAGPMGLKNVPADIEDKYKMMTENRAIAEQIISLTIHGNDPAKEFFKTTIMDDTMSALNNIGVAFVKALQNIDYSAEVARINKPLVVFHGTHDWVVDQQSSKDYTELVAGSKFVVLPDNGHCLNYENPERLAAEIQSLMN